MFLFHEHEPNKMAHWFKMPLCKNKMQLHLEIVMIWQVQLLTSRAGLNLDQKFAMNPWAHLLGNNVQKSFTVLLDLSAQSTARV